MVAVHRSLVSPMLLWLCCECLQLFLLLLFFIIVVICSTCDDDIFSICYCFVYLHVVPSNVSLYLTYYYIKNLKALIECIRWSSLSIPIFCSLCFINLHGVKTRKLADFFFFLIFLSHNVKESWISGCGILISSIRCIYLPTILRISAKFWVNPITNRQKTNQCGSKHNLLGSSNKLEKKKKKRIHFFILLPVVTLSFDKFVHFFFLWCHICHAVVLVTVFSR